MPPNRAAAHEGNHEHMSYPYRPPPIPPGAHVLLTAGALLYAARAHHQAAATRAEIAAVFRAGIDIGAQIAAARAEAGP